VRHWIITDDKTSCVLELTFDPRLLLIRFASYTVAVTITTCAAVGFHENDFGVLIRRAIDKTYFIKLDVAKKCRHFQQSLE
jgi:hypothetical protein